MFVPPPFLLSGLQRDYPSLRTDRVGEDVHDGIGVRNHRQVRRRAERTHSQVRLRFVFFVLAEKPPFGDNGLEVEEEEEEGLQW